MNALSTSVRTAAFALALGFSLVGGAAAAGEIHVLLGVDPADSTSDVLLSASLAPAQSLTRVTGQRTTIAQTSSMAEVMRASRTVENEIIIAPAHVTSSAILHAYQLLATSGQEQVYALVVKNDIDKVEKLPGKRLYLPTTNPLLAAGYPGTIGLKTGYTSEAGRCLIAVVRHGNRTLAAVLLHSPNPGEQAKRLLEKAFRTS